MKKLLLSILSIFVFQVSMPSWSQIIVVPIGPATCSDCGGGSVPSVHGRGGAWEAGGNSGPSRAQQERDRANAAEAARTAAIAKATAAEKARQKDAEDAAHELLLRLGDQPLEFDSYIVEKAWDRLSGLFITENVSMVLKTLTPSQFGKDSWFDLAVTKREMLGARYLLQKDLDDQKNAQKIKEQNERDLGLPPSPTPPVAPEPESQEEKHFFDAMRGLASARSDDTKFVVEQLITRGRLSSEMPLKLETVRSVVNALAPLTPPNSCVVTNRWACPMSGGNMLDSCICPGIGNGKEGLRQMSEFCRGASSSCRFPTSFPVGTPCNCAEDTRIAGPIPWGNIVPRPVRR